MATTSIEWSDAVWNPVSGCTRASAGCDNCYAVKMTHRLSLMGQAEKYGGLTVLNGKGERHFNGVVRTHEDALTIPLKWRKPRKVFVNSMSDLFHRDVPFEFIDKVFAVMALTPHHTYQVLTKRPERMAEYFAPHERPRPMVTMPQGKRAPAPSHLSSRFTREEMVVLAAGEFLPDDAPRGVMASMKWPLPNVWLGTSVENQAAADERIPHLLKCPAAVRFLSCEPLLGPVDLAAVRTDQGHGSQVDCLGNVYYDGRLQNDAFDIMLKVDWVIVGGESGSNARDYRMEWDLAIERQCRAAGVAYYRKQLGAHPLLDYYTQDESLREWALSGRHRVLVPCRSGWYEHHTRDGQPRPGSVIAPILRDKKGGDWSEWPEDLRVREFPKPKAES